jgi:hypothetical protein
MSMICWVQGLSPAQIAALRAAPSLVGDLAFQVRLDRITSGMSPEKKQAHEAQLLGSMEAAPGAQQMRARMAVARTRLAEIGPFEQVLCLEKSWHILHYLFTGHIDPSNAPGDALLTGEDLGEDVGYGPARLHDQRGTRDFGRFLETLDLARL